MEGILLKWTNFISGWKERYFKLDERGLHYSVEKGQEYKDTFPIGSLKVVDSGKESTFKVEYIDKELSIRTPSQEEKTAWINKINQMKTEYLKKRDEKYEEIAKKQYNETFSETEDKFKDVSSDEECSRRLHSLICSSREILEEAIARVKQIETSIPHDPTLQSLLLNLIHLKVFG